jgi:DNA-binding NarL/FixJ family response regulator
MAPRKVFIVEDSALVRERLTALLGEIGGFEVVGHAAGADDALAGIRGRCPDVIILDLQLAQGSGLDVLTAVKEENPACRVMVLTNHSLPQYRKKCNDAGADFFFDKVTEFDQVLATCKGLFCQPARPPDPDDPPVDAGPSNPSA